MTIREPHLHDTDPERTPMAAPWPDPLPPDATRDEAMDRAERSCDAYGLLPREARRRAGERWDQEHATTPAAPVIGQQIAESKPCICPITPGYIKHFPWCAKAKATPPAAPDEAAVEALCGIWIQTVLGDEWSAHQRAGCHHPIYSPTVARAILAAIRAGKVPGIITEDKASELTTRLTAEAIACQEMLGREIATLKTDLEATTSAYATRLKAYNEMKIERDTLKAEVERLKKACHQRMDEIGAKQSHIAALTGERDAAIARAEQLAKELAYTRALGTTSVDQTASEMELQRTRADAAERRVVELVGLLRWWASEYGAHSNHPSAIATRAALAAAPPPDIAVGRAPFVQLLLDLRETLKGTEDKRAIARAMIESALAAAPTTDGGASGVGR